MKWIHAIIIIGLPESGSRMRVNGASVRRESVSLRSREAVSFRSREAGSIAYAKGIDSEERALHYLEKRGFSVLAQRYKTTLGEIDLIAQKGDVLHIVEVKARPTLSKAREAIVLHQRRRIIQATEIFLQETEPAYTDLLFDALFLTESQICFLEDAWRVQDVMVQ